MLFISYAHADGADLAQRLQADLVRAGHAVWLDRARLAAGASWSADIEQAIDKSKVVLALLSPGSFVSDICRGEQLRALRQRKRLIVVMVQEDTDRPVFLETKLYISFAAARDYAQALAELVAELSGSVTATLAPTYQQTYVTAPRLPANTVLRPEELQSARASVLRDESPPTIGTAAIIGMAGIGKTTLAQMLCHDRIVQDAYPDGIIWVGLGKEVTDLIPKLREVGRALNDDIKHYDTLEGSSNRLRTILRKRAALIVLDDVWRLDQVEPLLADAGASTLLVTTRMHDIPVSLQARRVTIEALSHERSLEVLAQWTQIPVDEFPPEATDIVRECGRLPLALAMLGGLIHTGLLAGRPDAWAGGLHKLKEAQLDRIRFPLQHYPYSELQRAIQVSVEAIDARSRERYLTMSVFPEDTPIPEDTLGVLWGVDKYDMQDTVDSWRRASLANRDEQGRVVLHDLQLDYVRKAATNDIAALHQQLVDRYFARCAGKWFAGPNDGYYFQRVAWHMAGARNWKQLSALLLDSSFIRAKLDMTSYVELRQDFQWTPSLLSATDEPGDLRLVGELAAAVDGMTGFVNRRAETAQADRWFDSESKRFLIVHGLGGMGKTMLLRHLWVRWPRDTVYLTLDRDTSPIDFLRKLAGELASRAAFPAFPTMVGPAPVSHIASWFQNSLRLCERDFRVIVDEFEHAVPEFLQLLCFLSQDLRFILAARTAELGRLLMEEATGAVEFLSLQGLQHEEGAALFVQRAKAAKPDFQATAEDQATIAQLVTLLEGLPLAIELAAARVRVMSPRTLLARMSQRFKLLSSKGGRPNRQVTLRATFDWSWDLLPTAEKATLAQLSVFEGGFTLEAAESVLDLSRYDDAPLTVDAVNTLVDKSWVRTLGNERFDLLVSAQAYAAEHLQTQGRYAGSGPQALIAVQVRHAAWFAALGPIRATERACADLDNLVAACRRAVSLGDGDRASGALDGAWATLYYRGPYGTGVELAESVCAMPGLGDRAAAYARLVLASALIACGRSGSAETLYEQALTFARAAGDERCEARAMRQMASLLIGVGRTGEARAQSTAAIQFARDLRDRRLECEAINGLGDVEQAEGRGEEAFVCYEHALTLARAFGDRNVQGMLLGNLANVLTTLGRFDEALTRSEEALVLVRETGNRWVEGNTLCNLGLQYLLEGRLDEAHAASHAALVLARELGAVLLECVVRCNLGIVLERQALPDEALAQLEAAVRMAHAFNAPRYEGQFLGYLGLLHARQGRHEDAQQCLDSGEALLRSASDRLRLGVHLTSLAEARQLAGDTAAARASLAAATTIAAEVGAGPTSEIGSALTRVRALFELV